MNPVVVSIAAYVFPYVQVTINSVHRIFIDTEDLPHDALLNERITEKALKRCTLI